MKKKIFILILLSLLLLNSFSYAANNEKTVIIILDELDFDSLRILFDDKSNYTVGLMNSKTGNLYSEESFFMTLATGRRIDIEKDKFKGIHREDDKSLKVIEYEKIIEDLNKKYPDFSERSNFFGEKLKSQGISYMGNDSSSLLCADKNGKIQYGTTSIIYDDDWLVEKSKEFLENTNILILSLKDDEEQADLKMLKNYIEGMNDSNIILFSRKVPSNMKKILNNTLIPIVYSSNHIKNGILTSNSTKREGIVTNLDFLSQVFNMYDIGNHTNIGKQFRIIPSRYPIDDIEMIFKGIINMSWITYIFHGITYFIIPYFTYFIVKRRSDRYKDIAFYYNFCVINIFISLALGLTNIHRNLLLYTVLVLVFSYILSSIFSYRKINPTLAFSFLTYILLLFSIFIYPNMLYNSFIGYDNLIVGSRFYGFNNGAMAVLLATSIISYFGMVQNMSNNVQKALIFPFFLLNIIALSGKFGANTGGFFTSIVLFLIVIYIVLFEKKFTFMNILFLMLIGILILVTNFYIDVNNTYGSHAGSLILRIKTLGGKELLDIVKVKLKQLLLYTISPPWIVVFISEILWIKSFWDIDRERYNFFQSTYPLLRKEYVILLTTAVIAFIVNDTGVIAFIYMVQYLLTLFINIICEE